MPFRKSYGLLFYFFRALPIRALRINHVLAEVNGKAHASFDGVRFYPSQIAAHFRIQSDVIKT